MDSLMDMIILCEDEEQNYCVIRILDKYLCEKDFSYYLSNTIDKAIAFDGIYDAAKWWKENNDYVKEHGLNLSFDSVSLLEVTLTVHNI